MTRAFLDGLYGTWKLVSWTRHLLDTGETVQAFGPAPTGFLSYGRDGRVFFIMTGQDRARPSDPTTLTDADRAKLYDTMVAYGGTFTFDGQTAVHHVDIAWNQVWAGTAQVRHLEMDGPRLVMRTDPQAGIDGRRSTGVFVWERVTPAGPAGAAGGDAPVEALYGTWRLVSWVREVVGTGERSDIFGKVPHGFIAYTRDGRMSSIVVKENRHRPTDLAKLTGVERATLFNSMVAMAGRATVEGSRVVHSIDISWNETWTGTGQVRHFSIEGSRLTIRTDPAPSPVDGKPSIATLVWEKVE